MDRFPNTDPFQKHLDKLLAEASQSGWRKPLKECEVGRADLLTAAMVRRLWQLGCTTPEALPRLFLLTELCRELLRKKLPLTLEQLEAVAHLSSEPTALTEFGKQLVRQFEWHEPLPETVRLGIIKMRRVLDFLEEDSLAVRCERLLARSEPALEAVTGPTQRRKVWSRFLSHARRVPQTPSKRWRKKARSYVERLGAQRLTERVLPWIWERRERLNREEPYLLLGIVTACAALSGDQAVIFLDNAARWGGTQEQGHGARALRLADRAAQSLGLMGTDSAIQALICIEQETEYTLLRRAARKALTVAAQGKGQEWEGFRERAAGSPPYLDNLESRLERAFAKRLEQQLRTEEVLRLGEWKQRYHHSPLLRDLSDRLFWSSEGKILLGSELREVHDPSRKVKLWHPADSAESVRLTTLRKLKEKGLKQPFHQSDRRAYHQPATESCSQVRQHQFAALARERGWHFHLVGSRKARDTATLTLGDCRVEIEVSIDPNRRDVDRNGLAYKVHLTPPRFHPAPSARQMSEATRDWWLFCRVAGKNS